MLEGSVPRLLKVEERKTVKLSGNTALGEKRLDELLCAIAGSGVADHPAGDVIGDCAETAVQVRHLVLYDHVEAERLAIRHCR